MAHIEQAICKSQPDGRLVLGRAMVLMHVSVVAKSSTVLGKVFDGVSTIKMPSSFRPEWCTKRAAKPVWLAWLWHAYKPRMQCPPPQLDREGMRRLLELARALNTASSTMKSILEHVCQPYLLHTLEGGVISWQPETYAWQHSPDESSLVIMPHDGFDAITMRFTPAGATQFQHLLKHLMAEVVDNMAVAGSYHFVALADKFVTLFAAELSSGNAGGSPPRVLDSITNCAFLKCCIASAATTHALLEPLPMFFTTHPSSGERIVFTEIIGSSSLNSWSVVFHT